jgi:hypothetical protein
MPIKMSETGLRRRGALQGRGGAALVCRPVTVPPHCIDISWQSLSMWLC